jgi:hypothetical protein
MSPTRIFILTRNVHTRQVRRHGKIECYTCGEPICVGHKVHTTPVRTGESMNYKTKYRHYDCAKRVGLI